MHPPQYAVFIIITYLFLFVMLFCEKYERFLDTDSLKCYNIVINRSRTEFSS